jgi:hypothetical protein
LLAALVIGLAVLPAAAQFSGDAGANSKIDEAINSYYLMMELDKAESSLMNAISACGDNCSPQTKAKAWMYVGIVRGSGKSDQAGAAEAFSMAKGLDPNVQLDSDLASDETRATFQNATGSGGGEPVAEEPTPMAAPVAAAGPGALPPPSGVPGNMICSPQGAPIGVGMPVPMSCSSDQDIADGFVKFKEPGSSEWKKIALMDMGGLWQAEIPCKYTGSAGELLFYVGMKDSSGEYVDQFGSKKAPGTIVISEGGAAPSYPGQAPVTSCGAGAGSDCPPNFPGCGQSEAVCGDLDWGAACKNSSQCKCGLLCEDGACATAPSCTTNDECPTGACVDGLCSALSSGGGAESGDLKKHWLSFTVSMDLMPYGGNNLCGASEDYDVTYGIQCYNSAGERIQPEGIDIRSGLVPGQLRVNLGYDFAFTPHMQLGARLGVGFLNAHPTAEDDVPFLPLQAAGRFTYTFTPLTKTGLRAALYAEGGLGEVNAKISTDNVRVYKVAGRLYGAPGGTFGYAFAPNMSLNADVQLAILFPAGGAAISIRPGLNFVYGL